MEEHDHVLDGRATFAGLLGAFMDLPPVRRHVYFYFCLLVATVAAHQLTLKPGPQEGPVIVTYVP